MKFNWLILLFKEANANWKSRIFTLVLIAAVTYSVTQIFKAKGSSQTANCETQIKPYAEQVKILSQTLEQVSKAVDALTSGRNVTGYMPTKTQWLMRSAVYRPDTTRPLTRNQELIVLLKLKKMMDSAKIKVDSIDKKQQKRKT